MKKPRPSVYVMLVVIRRRERVELRPKLSFQTSSQLSLLAFDQRLLLTGTPAERGTQRKGTRGKSERPHNSRRTLYSYRQGTNTIHIRSTPYELYLYPGALHQPHAAPSTPRPPTLFPGGLCLLGSRGTLLQLQLSPHFGTFVTDVRTGSNFQLFVHRAHTGSPSLSPSLIVQHHQSGLSTVIMSFSTLL